MTHDGGPHHHHVDEMLIAKRKFFEYKQVLPGGYAIMVRDEEHEIGSCPCMHRPPATGDVRHFNFEFHAPNKNSPKGRKKVVFNLHGAAWQDGNKVCFASWTKKKCLQSKCFRDDDIDMNDLKQLINELAHEITAMVKDALKKTGQAIRWIDTHVVPIAKKIAAIVVFVVLLPFLVGISLFKTTFGIALAPQRRGANVAVA